MGRTQLSSLSLIHETSVGLTGRRIHFQDGFFLHRCDVLVLLDFSLLSCGNLFSRPYSCGFSQSACLREVLLLTWKLTSKRTWNWPCIASFPPCSLVKVVKELAQIKESGEIDLIYPWGNRVTLQKNRVGRKILLKPSLENTICHKWRATPVIQARADGHLDLNVCIGEEKGVCSEEYMTGYIGTIKH